MRHAGCHKSVSLRRVCIGASACSQLPCRNRPVVRMLHTARHRAATRRESVMQANSGHRGPMQEERASKQMRDGVAILCATTARGQWAVGVLKRAIVRQASQCVRRMEDKMSRGGRLCEHARKATRSLWCYVVPDGQSNQNVCGSVAPFVGDDPEGTAKGCTVKRVLRERHETVPTMLHVVAFEAERDGSYLVPVAMPPVLAECDSVVGSNHVAQSA